MPIRCPKCHSENLPDSLFCEECSAPLEATCPACGVGNGPTAKFCRKCRAELKGAGIAGRGNSMAPASAAVPARYTPKHLADKILQSKVAFTSGGESLLPRLREAEARLAGRTNRDALIAGLREAEAMYRAMGAPDPAARLTQELGA